LSLDFFVQQNAGDGDRDQLPVIRREIEVVEKEFERQKLAQLTSGLFREFLVARSIEELDLCGAKVDALFAKHNDNPDLLLLKRRIQNVIDSEIVARLPSIGSENPLARKLRERIAVRLRHLPSNMLVLLLIMAIPAVAGTGYGVYRTIVRFQVAGANASPISLLAFAVLAGLFSTVLLLLSAAAIALVIELSARAKGGRAEPVGSVSLSTKAYWAQFVTRLPKPLQRLAWICAAVVYVLLVYDPQAFAHRGSATNDLVLEFAGCISVACVCLFLVSVASDYLIERVNTILWVSIVALLLVLYFAVSIAMVVLFSECVHWLGLIVPPAIAAYQAIRLRRN
jgi:hypothetical protein